MHLQSSELCARLTLAAPGHRLTWHVPFSPVTRGHGQPSGAGGGSPGRLVPRTHSASLSPADSLASRAPAPPFTPAPSERFNCARPTVLAWKSPGPLPPSLPPAPARVAPSRPVSGNSVLTIRELVRVTGLQAPPEQDPRPAPVSPAPRPAPSTRLVLTLLFPSAKDRCAQSHRQAPWQTGVSASRTIPCEKHNPPHTHTPWIPRWGPSGAQGSGARALT